MRRSKRPEAWWSRASKRLGVGTWKVPNSTPVMNSVIGGKQGLVVEPLGSSAGTALKQVAGVPGILAMVGEANIAWMAADWGKVARVARPLGGGGGAAPGGAMGR